MKALRILYVSTQSATQYLRNLCLSLQGGGEVLGVDVCASVLTINNEKSDKFLSLHNISRKTIFGDSDRPWTVAADELIASLQQADVILVDQCLSYFGLYVAAHANLLGKCVVGIHQQAEEYFLSYCAEVSSLFDLFYTNSELEASIYQNLNRPMLVFDADDLKNFGMKMLTTLQEYLQ